MTFQSLDGRSASAEEVTQQRLLAKKLLNDRLQRADFFSKTLFSETAWDATLVLFSSEPFLSHCADSLAGQLDVPLTTMTRWIDVLEGEGVIEIRSPSAVPSKATLRLSSTGRNAVRGYLGAIMRAVE